MGRGAHESREGRAESRGRVSASAWWMLGLLFAFYVASFVDRLSLSMLAGPLQADLGLSDKQLGLLLGTTFGVAYALFGIPAARIADKGNRKRLIVVGSLSWGACTMLSGLADSFFMLIILRLGVAIGEATLTPAAYSMIADAFPPERRFRAASIYAAAAQLGIGLSYSLGGVALGVAGDLTSEGPLRDMAAWQLALVLLGAPTILLGLSWALTVREPRRQHQGEAIDMNLLPYLMANLRLYGGLVMGSSVYALVLGALVVWTPELLRRGYNVPIEEAGYLLTLTGLIGGTGGVLLTPVIVRWMDKWRPGEGIVYSFLLCGTLAVAFVTVGLVMSSPLGFAFFYILTLMNLAVVTTGVSISLVVIAPSNVRATIIAINLMTSSFIGLGFGPFLAALLNDYFAGTYASLVPGLVSLSAAGWVVGTSLFLLSIAPLRRRFREAELEKT